MKNIKLTAALLTFFGICSAQENITYQKPSATILQLADYQRAPDISISSGKRWMVYTYRNTYKSLADLNQDEIRLAGLRINPKTQISSSITYSTNLKVRKMNDASEIQVKNLPQNPQISYVSYSPDETKLAFTNTTENGVELWTVDLETATAQKLADRLNAALGSPYTWYRNSKDLLVKRIIPNRPALINSAKDLPTGPIVSVSDGKPSQNRTYADLLKNPQDEANFETLATSELWKIAPLGQPKKLKDAAIYTGTSFSPDGSYLLITTIQRPFSYIVPLSRFPMRSVVYDQEMKAVKTVNEVPLTETMPKGFSSVRKGRRDFTWRNDKPATLVFAEALDNGDQQQPAEYRDLLLQWTSPFDNQPQELLKLKQRYSGIDFTNSHYAVVTESWYDTRNKKSFLVDLNTLQNKIIEDRNYQDIYSDPGNFSTTKNQYGREVIEVRKNSVYLIGKGFSKEGKKPFIDEFNLDTLKKNRIYTSNLKNVQEDIIDIIDLAKGEILTRQQSATLFPNYLKRNISTGKSAAITHFANPFPSLEKVYKEVIKYKRNDGVELTGTLYLPAGYNRKTKAEKLPLLIWAYPTEYKDKNTASQNTQNDQDFTYPSYGSFIYWVNKGYAVLDDAAFPIIGEGKAEPNDTFLPQLIADGRAAIDAVDQLGYIDRKRVAIGGHSYGAFMTANLLTHTKDYACGIARSGAYNRTLTPFGFQSEQRNYWDVPALYNEMSPFMNADKMKTPLLLIHGDADNNPGTFTLQTERYFQALKNLGAPVRMVLLPKEQHGYAAKESVLHVLWEQEQFLDKCLKK